jgi:hypothetical protein
VVAWRGPPDPDAPLIVLLHGRGSNEADIIALADHLPAGPAYAAVRCPPGAHVWLPVGLRWQPSLGASPSEELGDEACLGNDMDVHVIVGQLDVPPLEHVGMTGFGASPGAEVEPTWSMRTATSWTAGQTRRHAASNQLGHAGS